MKNISIFIVLMFLFSACSTAQKLQKKVPADLKDVYFQKWISGIKGGGSGMDLYIPLSSELSKTIQLDSVYFRGKVVLLERMEAEQTLYIGRFKTDINTKPVIVMSSDPNEEYGNQAPIINKKSVFDLKDSECVVSYKDQNERKYFKIENVLEKPSLQYPGLPDRQ